MGAVLLLLLLLVVTAGVNIRNDEESCVSEDATEWLAVTVVVGCCDVRISRGTAAVA